ncbi:MAG: tryptophan 7-halogenase [Verrucomicrobia bacterium]|nr:tryptophan 7-halogenase [Verrucomicrobiota bacterium]
MSASFDLAVLGSGFAGSLLAMIARRLGRSVVLLERGRHPRFVIGESSTPLANLLWEELALRYDLPRLAPLAKWGAWQRTYPQIGCGLKRGFTFYHHAFGQRFGADPDRCDQLLVAASPHDAIADTHWYRPDFDHFLVREAAALGVEYFDETKLGSVQFDAGGATLTGERAGQLLRVHARFILDASGQRGALHRALALPEQSFEHLPATHALFSHFSGVRRMDELADFQRSGATQPGSGSEIPPYPVDDAAVHHVFDGGWIWVLRFNNGLTSAGGAATSALAEELRFAEGAPAWDRLLARLPSVRAQFAGAEAVLPFVHLPRLSFRSGVAVGEGWALVPSAAGFVDPLLSTGFPLTLLGISRLAGAIEQLWNPLRFRAELDHYAKQTLAELDATALLIAALYASMKDFEVFAAFSLLYFAAASFSETARRLGRPELAGSFLLQDDPRFGPELRACCHQALAAASAGRLPAQSKRDLLARIARAIEPFDVAGLTNAARRNWHPVDAQDLFNAAPKLGVSAAEIEALLARCGFYPESRR